MKFGRRLAAVVVLAAGMWVVLPAAPASAAPIETACVGNMDDATSTFTLMDDCDTTEPLIVPDGFTVDGAGHTITAHDASATVSFIGAVVTNAGTSMHLRDLTIQGEGFPNVTCDLLAGIQFLDADGTISNVMVLDITRDNSCVSGNGLRVNAVAPRTVTITDTTLAGFQRSGLFANGPATVHVSGSTIGPPDDLGPGVNAQNAVQIGSGNAGGTFTGNTVIGRGFGGTGASSTAMLLFTSSNLTISNNTITGAGTDIGISVTSGSTNITIENNVIGRTAPGSPEIVGIGVQVDASSTGAATLVCNTFSGWVANLENVSQAPCITTTSLPGGTVGTPYSTQLAATVTDPEGTWALAAGSALPPGLTLAPDGTISGTPTTTGTFTFSATVTDAGGASATREFTITIGPAAAPVPAPTPAPTPTTPASGAGQATIAATGPESTGMLLAVAAILIIGGSALVASARSRPRG